MISNKLRLQFGLVAHGLRSCYNPTYVRFNRILPQLGTLTGRIQLPKGRGMARLNAAHLVGDSPTDSLT